MERHWANEENSTPFFAADRRDETSFYVVGGLHGDGRDGGKRVGKVGRGFYTDGSNKVGWGNNTRAAARHYRRKREYHDSFNDPTAWRRLLHISVVRDDWIKRKDDVDRILVLDAVWGNKARARLPRKRRNLFDEGFSISFFGWRKEECCSAAAAAIFSLSSLSFIISRARRRRTKRKGSKENWQTREQRRERESRGDRKWSRRQQQTQFDESTRQETRRRRRRRQRRPSLCKVWKGKGLVVGGDHGPFFYSIHSSWLWKLPFLSFRRTSSVRLSTQILFCSDDQNEIRLRSSYSKFFIWASRIPHRPTVNMILLLLGKRVHCCTRESTQRNKYLKKNAGQHCSLWTQKPVPYYIRGLCTHTSPFTQEPLSLWKTCFYSLGRLEHGSINLAARVLYTNNIWMEKRKQKNETTRPSDPKN